MKIKLKQYKFEKVEIDSMDFECPTETQYFFQAHYRRSIKVKPVYSSWLKEEGKEEKIIHYEITFIYLSFECRVERHALGIDSIERIYNQSDDKLNDFVVDWVDGDLYLRDKEQFEGELEHAISEFKK